MIGLVHFSYSRMAFVCTFFKSGCKGTKIIFTLSVFTLNISLNYVNVKSNERFRGRLSERLAKPLTLRKPCAYAAFRTVE